MLDETPCSEKVGLSLWLFGFFFSTSLHEWVQDTLAAETHVNTIKLWDPSTSSTSGSQGPRILLVGVCHSAKAHPQFWHSPFVIFHKSL